MSTDPYGAEAPLVNPDDLPKWIVAEDENVIVFNKPGWLVCHPSKNGPWSSLVGAAREYLGLDRLHLVSRLDRETSGVVVLAKNHQEASRLQTALAQRKTAKRYLAILEGSLTEERTVDAGLGPDTRSAVVIKQKVTFSRAGKPSVTRFRPLYSRNAASIVEVVPVSGRKHQIRAHADWIGHRVVADKIYGADAEFYLEFITQGWTSNLEAHLPMQRQALHAYEIRFDLDDRFRQWLAPVPEDLRECWLKLTGEPWPEIRGNL